MIPEIDLLIKHFDKCSWNKDTQTAFMEILREEDFFNGKGANDPAFSARDRINRAPKSLGFIQIEPTIGLTPAGESLLKSKRKDEVFLRQMLKFQVPSPYHEPSNKAAVFWVKPYLEMLRLIRVMGTLKFDELQLFGMQLTDYRDFDKIVDKIKKFRVAKTKNNGSYRLFKTNYLYEELKQIYYDRIIKGETKTRESHDKSLANFLKTQSNNMRDYADACFRYLRATGLVSVSHVGKSLSIVRERIEDVDFILNTVGRDPIFVDDKEAYLEYIGSEESPKLLTDNRDLLVNKIHKEFPDVIIDEKLSIDNLKDLLADLLEERKKSLISNQIKEIKEQKLYDDIQNTYTQIAANKLYDAPLMLEWNTWRAMTMLDGGNIKANLSFDDYGRPLSTAAGNMADVVCDYGCFMVAVEVTMAGGQKQYEMEGEPVSRHLGKMKRKSEKPCYGLFLAPTINEACITHFYTLHHLNLALYGGKSVIVPLPLRIFGKMIEDSYKVDYVPNPLQVQRFFETSKEISLICSDEKDWYNQIIQKALHWLE